MVVLEITVTGLKLRHPLMNASGILASSGEGALKLIEAGVSAVVTKTITLEPREGYNPPVVIPVGFGLVNAIGLSNPGLSGLREIIDVVKKHSLPVVVSISGRDVDEFVKLASSAEDYGADAIELNLSCPNVRDYGLYISTYMKAIIRDVKGSVNIPVWAKLGFSPRIVEEAGMALESGADALVLINTIPAVVIDVYVKKPVLSNVFGGLSGPPIHPIMLYAVYSVYREYRCEIIGVGGVVDWISAVDTILAGARALQIGTGFYLKGFKVVENILSGIVKYMEDTGVSRLEDLVGAAHS